MKCVCVVFLSVLAVFLGVTGQQFSMLCLDCPLASKARLKLRNEMWGTDLQSLRADLRLGKCWIITTYWGWEKYRETGVSVGSWVDQSNEYKVWAKADEIERASFNYSKSLSISLTHGKYIRH